MSEVFNFIEEVEKRKKIVATCPQCDGQLWFIHVDKLEVYDNILAFQCGNEDCGFTVYLGKIKVLSTGEEE